MASLELRPARAATGEVVAPANTARVQYEMSNDTMIALRLSVAGCPAVWMCQPHRHESCTHAYDVSLSIVGYGGDRTLRPAGCGAPAICSRAASRWRESAGNGEEKYSSYIAY